MIRRLTVLIATLTAAILLAASPAQASTLGITWNHSSGHAPYVMVEDHTGWAWPVTAGVSKWSYGLHYGHCYNSQCVRVYEVNWGRNGVVGKTNILYSGTHFVSATIYLNDAYSYLSYSNRLQAATHELGHALGLGHDSYWDVMHPSICGCLTISSYERSELAWLYR